MNVFSAIGTMWTISREVEGAWDAFQNTLAGGGSVAEAVSAFAAKTDSTQMDDQLADEIVRSLNVGIEYLGLTAQMIADATMFISKHGPEVALSITKFVMQLQKLRG